MCDLLAIFNFHALVSWLILTFDSRTFVSQVFERFAGFFGHVGIEHASVEFRILNAWFYMYTIKTFLHRKSLIRCI